MLFLLFSFSANAQTLQGIVTDAGTGAPIYAVIVVNVSTQQASSTNEHGLYTIAAKPGDVIAFSYIGYKTEQRTNPLFVMVGNMNIAMQREEYQLREFKLRPGLTQYQIDSAERMSIYKIPLERTHPSPVNSPASAIAEQFSKRAKNVYKFQQNFKEGEIEKFTDTRYAPALVSKLTGLDGDSIGHFMYAYPMPYDFARTATDLEIKIWIRENYKAWIKQQPVADTVMKN